MSIGATVDGNGIVTTLNGEGQRLVSTGEYVGDKPLIKLVVLNPLHAEVVMNVEQYGIISKGEKVRVAPDNNNGELYPGVVTIVDQIIDAASNTFGVRVEIPNPDLKFTAGLKCRVHYLDEEESE